MKLLVVPDIHGRTFWKDVIQYIETDEYDKIIFLGDYLDPYQHEKISDINAFNNFIEILNLKKSNPEKIILLMGNHDLGYLDNNICECRKMYEFEDEIKSIFLDEKHNFDITYKVNSNDKIILFSHAGFSRTFVNILKENFMDDDEWACIDTLNEWFHQDMNKHVKKVYQLLGFCGRERGGYHPTGSCVWEDVFETTCSESCLENTIQIFGHTSLSVPKFTSQKETMNCIDSQRVFIFDTETLDLSELNKDVTKESTE